ncbi:unnamed protein product [Rotaria sordida]|uniref:Uncharacterized protein n=1 Tax=Rotaria sordida TaxID=392033 RepID=A0A813SV98_9BILA|nr:unnamed protein product [Rotaria sordida]CAF0801943.1 unnamed protein product [Rotaria sordida]
MQGIVSDVGATEERTHTTTQTHRGVVYNKQTCHDEQELMDLYHVCLFISITYSTEKDLETIRIRQKFQADEIRKILDQIIFWPRLNQ